MTIVERIQLHKLGYTKEEINQLAADNYNPAGLTDPQPEQLPDIPADPEPPVPVVPGSGTQSDNSAVLAAINNLTAALQANAIKTTPQPETPKETVEDTLFNIIK